MTAGKRNFGRSSTAATDAPSIDLTALRQLRDRQPKVTAEELCDELSKAFRVQPTEVALLRRDGDYLRFVFPPELREVGLIPLSSATVAAHTAATRRVDMFNRFARVKHASVFEGVRLQKTEPKEQAPSLPIQKLMSAPVLDAEDNVLGVIQISRKGHEVSMAGPDFTRDDLQQLQHAAQLVAQVMFLSEAAELK